MSLNHLPPSRAALVVIAILGLTSRSSAENVNSTPVACADDAIGLARTLELDTTQGPQLGGKSGDDSLLADGEIVLTFEDGPMRARTAAVLATLDRHCTKATFLLIGRQARAEPDLVRDIARRGHTIGTHTYSHDSARLAGSVRAKADAELGFSVVSRELSRELGRTAAPLFRFPNSDTPDNTALYVRNRQIALVLGDIDPNDVQRKDATAVRASVLKQLTAKRKGILVLRDTVPATVETLDALLTEIKRLGFRVVHLQPRTSLVTLAEFDTIAEALGTGAEIGDPLARQFAWPDDPVPSSGATAPKAPAKAATSPPAKAPERRPVPRAEARPQPPPAPKADENWATTLYRSIIKALPPAAGQ